MARAEGLTTYDATYLELAVRLKLPLLTKDNELAKEAKQLDVVVLSDSGKKSLSARQRNRRRET
jgi:rRNA-processing protein FCF1